MKFCNAAEILNRSFKKPATDSYQPIDTVQVIESLGLSESECTLKKFGKSTKHQLTFVLKDLPSTYIGGDEVYPTLHIFNSFQGDGALMVAFGLLRSVCSNGLVAGPSIFNCRAIHVKGPKINYIIDNLAAQVKENLTEEKICEYYRLIDQLDGERCDRTTIERILDDMKLTKSVYFDALFRYENPIRPADIGSSAWMAFNRVQEVIASHRNGVKGMEWNRRLMQCFLDNTVEFKKPKSFPKLRLVG